MRSLYLFSAPTVLVPTVLVPTVLVPTVLVPTVLVPTVLAPRIGRSLLVRRAAKRWPANQVFLGIIICALALPTLAQKPFTPPPLKAMSMVLKESQSLATEDRLREVTEPLVGAPYVLSPLGEGAGVDDDPRLRLDAFDCTTFVETSLALSLAKTSTDVQPVLDLIRYRTGRPHFNNRRHFPEAEWIPDLIALGLLEDVTEEVAGPTTEVASKTLDLKSWDRRRKKILSELDRERIPRGTFSLKVWPIASAKADYRRIPPGTVLSVVRSDRARVPVRVSHQGLVIKKDGKLYLRHAANKVYARVVDEPLAWFLARNAKYKKWPVTGIHLARVVTPKADWRRTASAQVQVQAEVSATR